MLDLDPTRAPAVPRPAATILLLRERAGLDEIEVCVMQRSKQSSFMGGAVVFPGGRIEPADAGPAWRALTVRGEGVWWDDEGCAARVAACREALEEVGLAPIPGASAADLAGLRKSKTLAEDLRALGRTLDLTGLVPFARWVTPEAEQRRFDARFFLAGAPEGLEPQSDDHEAVRVMFASPSALLDQFERDEIALFPPTHRSLEVLRGLATVELAYELARSLSLEVICPRFALDDGKPVLALPGDPLHEIREPRVPGPSRYVLEDARWTSRNAPGTSR